MNQLANFNSIYVLGLGPSFNHSSVKSILITFACSEEMAEDMVGERVDQKNTKVVNEMAAVSTFKTKQWPCLTF